MTLDEAIKHAEEVAIDKADLACTLWNSKEKARCEECEKEHRQLAEWLKELKRHREDPIQVLPSVNPQASNEDIHKEREQAYMKGYEDASKRYRTEPCDDAISRSDAIRVASGYCHWSNVPKELAKLPSVNPIPCEDAISRQAAIRIAEQGQVQGFEWQFKQLVDLPSISTEKTGWWIPVSERLPEDHDWYVIVVKEKSTGYQYIPRIASHSHDNCWSIIDTEDADKEWLDDLECIAWMPLPAPYDPQESEVSNG